MGVKGVRMRVGIIDLLGKSAPKSAKSRFVRMQNTSIMPQVVAAWCEREGHETSFAYYSGPEVVAGGLADRPEIVFINAFSSSALVAYALSAYFRSKGAVTVLGGPHARSFPEHAVEYFDYVVGLCDQGLIRDILQDAAPHRPVGQHLSTERQPSSLPGFRERWKFLKPAMDKAPFFKLVPMIGSLGCPYTCSFCIDAAVTYQPLEFEGLKDDLRFFAALALPRSMVLWHDPNFGVRFDEYLDVIEDAVPPKSITFFGEMSLALLKEKNLKRLARNGFKVMAPGIESWYDIGDKSRMRSITGMEKVRRVAEHVNLIQSYLPYTQANLIFGLDGDAGAEPFELTKRFVDLTPAIYPQISPLTAFGRNAAHNLEYQRAGRVIPVPFHFLDLEAAMNVRPKNYPWPDFYDRLCDVVAYAFSPRTMFRRFRANKDLASRLEQLVRGISSEAHARLGHHRRIRRWLEQPDVRKFFEGETRVVPSCFVEIVRNDLGPLWRWLPEGAISYDPNAYLHAETVQPSLRSLEAVGTS